MNNVNIKALVQSKEAIKNNPKLGLITWNTQVKCINGLKHEFNTRNFDSAQTDVGTSLGGNDSAPTPIEYLLNAAGGCFSITFNMLASQENIKINQFNLNIKSDFNASPFLGIANDYAGVYNTTFDLTVVAEATEKIISDLATLALDRSPVIASLKNKPILQVNK